MPTTPSEPPDAPRPPAAIVVALLYGAVAAAVAGLLVVQVQTGHARADGLWLFLPLLAYAAGLTYGSLALEVRPGRERALLWARRLMALHGLAGLCGAAVLGEVLLGPEGPGGALGLGPDLGWALAVVAMGTMLLAAPLSLWLPRCAKRTDLFVVAAFAGAGWIALMLTPWALSFAVGS